MPFFFLNGLKLAVFPGVYEPSDDSFLLAESVELAKGCCRKASFSPGFCIAKGCCRKASFSPGFCIAKGCSVLDLGTGSGIQGINAAVKGAARIVCTDVNENALKNAEENAKKAGFAVRFEFRQGQLFDCVKQGEKFDVVVFNPPYVPSEGKRFVDLDGGKKGRVVLGKFLDAFGRHLKKNGACFFLQSSLNGEKETANALKKNGFEARVVARKRLFFEELIVFRAEKGQSK